MLAFGFVVHYVISLQKEKNILGRPRMLIAKFGVQSGGI